MQVERVNGAFSANNVNGQFSFFAFYLHSIHTVPSVCFEHSILLRDTEEILPTSRGWLPMANDLRTLGSDSPSALVHIPVYWFLVPRAPARKPFVAVSALLVTRRRHRRGCARLARGPAFFSPQPPRIVADGAFLPSTSPGRLRASLLGPRNDLRDRLDSSFSLAPRHNSYPNCRLSSFPPARRGVPPSVLPAPYRPLMSPPLSW